VPDENATSNQPLLAAYQIGNMFKLAKVIAKGALMRDESRGAHYKPAFPTRNDKDFLKTTVATYDAANNECNINYEDVDLSLIEPRERNYEKDKKS